MIAFVVSATLYISGAIGCGSYPSATNQHYFSDEMPIHGDVKIHLAGMLNHDGLSVCIYAYHYWWNERETSRILVFSNGKLIGYYTLPYSKLFVRDGVLVGVNLDGDSEVIKIIRAGVLSKSIFFDGDTFPLNAPDENGAQKGPDAKGGGGN